MVAKKPPKKCGNSAADNVQLEKGEVNFLKEIRKELANEKESEIEAMEEDQEEGGKKGGKKNKNKKSMYEFFQSMKVYGAQSHK